MKKKKSPVAAAILNLLTPGLGYLYLPQRRLFGAMLLGGEVLIVTAPSGNTEAALEKAAETNWTLLVPAIIGVLLYYTAFAVDAYQSAKLGNQHG